MRLVVHLLLILVTGFGADLTLNRGLGTAAIIRSVSFQRIDAGVGVAQYHTSKGVSRKLATAPELAGLKPGR